MPLKEISSSKNAQDGPSVNVANKSSTCPCQMHVNAFGQVKTARNTKRPKPPLPPSPPMKKKKDKPTRFSQRLKSKQNEPNKVFRYMPLFNIYFYYLNVTCSLSLQQYTTTKHVKYLQLIDHFLTHIVALINFNSSNNIYLHFNIYRMRHNLQRRESYPQKTEVHQNRWHFTLLRHLWQVFQIKGFIYVRY